MDKDIINGNSKQNRPVYNVIIENDVKEANTIELVELRDRLFETEK